MNLESIEQRCLSYLKQVTNPLVPVENLWRHLRGADEAVDISEGDLLTFLRNHELFVVLDPPLAQAGSPVAEALAESGVPMGPRVVLCTRIPPGHEVSAMIQCELARMTEALTKALTEARATGNGAMERRLCDMLARSQRLAQEAQQLLGENADREGRTRS